LQRKQSNTLLCALQALYPYASAYRCVFECFDALLLIELRPRYIALQNIALQNQRIFGLISGGSFNLSHLSIA
jgi:hypothetical protein